MDGREARLFTIFIFISMCAFSMQDPILEPSRERSSALQLESQQNLMDFIRSTVIGIISIVLCLAKFRIGFGSLSIVKNARLGSERRGLLPDVFFPHFRFLYHFLGLHLQSQAY